MSEQFAAFLCYAHADDDDGNVALFAKSLEKEIEKQLGRPFSIFRDRRNLAWGNAWKKRINTVVDSSSFLVAILSPSFFASKECVREVGKFREREVSLGREDLILPVIWIHPDEVPPGNRDLAELLMSRQYVVWETYRFHKSYPITARRKLAGWAQQVKEAIRRPSNPTPDAQTAAPPPPTQPTPPKLKKPSRAKVMKGSGIAKRPSSPAPKPGEVRVHPTDGLSYVWIQPGEFDMGCSPGYQECSDDEKPLHRVKITRGFWIGQTPVTQAAYEKVMVNKQNPSRFEGAALPVDSVTWDEAAAYCKAVGGRLPTEAEWEFAARAGSTASRYGDLDRIAWWGGNSDVKTHPVGEKDPNAWGLYDTLGNDWDWVADRFDQHYYKSRPTPDIDPQGPEKGELRVLRGGSWYINPGDLRVSNRFSYHPGNRSFDFGFRCTREAFP